MGSGCTLCGRFPDDCVLTSGNVPVAALADYVDASIMLSFQRCGSQNLVTMGVTVCG
jgi:hypothetical protein